MVWLIQIETLHLFWTRYKNVLVSMMTNVLRKIQLHFNIDELREVDDDTIDDDVSAYADGQGCHMLTV